MSLTLATLLFGLGLIGAGGIVWFHRKSGGKPWVAFAKSGPAGIVLIAVAATWFLFHVTRLGEADFGEFRNILFLVFLGIALGSAILLQEYLAVRALAALWLLLSTPFLDAAFDQEPHGRLLMVSVLYLGILVSLYLAISPFRWRDFFLWLHQQQRRAEVLGIALAVTGLLCLLAILTY